MSNVWPTVTKQNPCPICKHHDWTCRFGDKAVVCMRVESEKPCASGGWYHFYGESKPTVIPKRKQEESPASQIVDWSKLIEKWKATGFQLASLGFDLHVTTQSLISLGAKYAPEYNAWAFPMRDGDGKICGIRLRNLTGEKWAVRGSKQGLFVSENSSSHSDNDLSDNNLRFKTCYIAEGPTDTAALLSMGLFAIGRANCLHGAEQIKQTLKRLKIHQAVVVADNDDIKKCGTRPGIAGAVKLRKELGIKSVVWIPPSPCKDVREFLKRGGTAKQIESDIKNRIWTK